MRRCVFALRLSKYFAHSQGMWMEEWGSRDKDGLVLLPGTTPLFPCPEPTTGAKLFKRACGWVPLLTQPGTRVVRSVLCSPSLHTPFSAP